MLISKSMVKKYGILFIAFLIAFVFVFLSNNVWIHIAVFTGICILPAFLVGFDLLHPYFWFSIFFYLYGVGFPILSATDYVTRTTYGKECMIYQLLALETVLIVISPESAKGEKDFNRYLYKSEIGLFNKIIYLILMILIFFGGIYTLRSKFTGKSDVYEVGGWIIRFIYKMPMVLVLMFTIFLISYYAKYKKINVQLILTTAVALIVITIYSGERDFLFRFLLIVVISFWFLEKINLKHLIILCPILLATLPLSTIYKYYFIRGTRTMYKDNIIHSIFAAEFESAATNLQVVLNHSSSTNGMLGFKQILYDIAGGFFSDIQSTGYLFHQMYYSNSRYFQYVFYIVGEGYFIAGALGVVILFVFVGLIIKFFFLYHRQNIYTVASYFYFITLVIYSIRGDFSVITAGLVKQIGFVVIILYVFEKLSKRHM